MKNYLFMLAIAVVLAACTSNKTRSFIPGTYVNHAESEYSIANDTLVIEPSADNAYSIHRKTGYRMIRHGKAGQPQFETEEWSGLYDEQTKVLTETRKGKVITFFPETGKLLVGKREYHKR